MNTRPELELHLAAQQGGCPDALRAAIYALGFRDDNIVDEDSTCCSLTAMHVTWDSFDAAAYREMRDRLSEVLNANAERTLAYAHGEVIRPEWDVDFAHAPYNSDASYPFHIAKPQQRDDPKHWDIHISVDTQTLDPRLAETLEQHGWYWITLRKANNRIVKVFTLQGTNAPDAGLEVFRRIKEYLEAVGGFSGSAKFEQTCFWQIVGQPSIIPPVVSSVEER
jgi:hypothetical protein